MTQFVSPDYIRKQFSGAMSQMYREEVPTYDLLLQLVAESNAHAHREKRCPEAQLFGAKSKGLILEERHGAIRVGTAHELSTLRRCFAVMGMYPVGYYDLSVADIPVHSTAFRPIERGSIQYNSFRIFTSLLRLELLDNIELADLAAATLNKRKIFTEEALSFLDKAEKDGGLSKPDADTFVRELLHTFKWHAHTSVSRETYERLHDAHRLVADIVGFRTPHINHLTPRVLDIDEIQHNMSSHGITPKAVVEGPPRRKCPILLRQTAFKAVEEEIQFTPVSGQACTGTHTARFGEIEQRGAALTPKGRALYDTLLTRVRSMITPVASGANSAQYAQILAGVFKDFPDNWLAIRKQGLAYFYYGLTKDGAAASIAGGVDGTIEDYIETGLVEAKPIMYEDFLPVSAAGIFLSNLGDESTKRYSAEANQEQFEQALGTPVIDPFEQYSMAQAASAAACLKALKPQPSQLQRKAHG